MSDSEDDPINSLFVSVYRQAWVYIHAGRHEDANKLCLTLLEQPDLGIYYQASCHLILAHSPDCYLQHANKAVELFRRLLTENEEDVQKKARLIAEVERVQEKAKKDAEYYGDLELTEEEHQEAISAMFDASERAQAEWDHHGEGNEQEKTETQATWQVTTQSARASTAGDSQSLHVTSETKTAAEPSSPLREE